MDRTSHMLRQSRGKLSPPSVVVLGCDLRPDETVRNPYGHRLVCERIVASALRWEGGEYTVHQDLDCASPESWWIWLEKSLCALGSVWVISDRAYLAMTVLGLWDRIDWGEWQLTDDQDPHAATGGAAANHRYRGLVVVEDPPTIVIARRTGTRQSVCWLDSRNWFTAPEDSPDPAPDQVRRIEQHWRAWVDLIRRHNLGQVQRTTGSQALHSYRSRYLRDRIWVHDRADVLAIERSAHYGGRCECYRIGDVLGPVWHVDVNSLYHAVALDLVCPARYAGHINAPTAAVVDRAVRSDCILGVVEVQTDTPLVPLRRDGLTVWPVGKFSTVLPHPELALALERGCISRVHSLLIYDGGLIFADWARDLDKFRRWHTVAGQPEISSAIKGLGLSLYGKFGQRGWRWENSDDGVPTAPWSTWYQRDKIPGELTRWRSVGWLAQRREEDGETAESVPAIAAWITSAGRVRLWQLQETAGREHVFYSDTDSLFVDQEGYERLDRVGEIAEGVLGKLKVIARYERLSISGIRHYLADGRYVCAGMPGSGQPIADCIGRGEYPERLGQALSEARPPRPVVSDQLVARDRSYRHGRVDGEGRVWPIMLR